MSTIPEATITKTASEDLAQYDVLVLGGSDDVEKVDGKGDLVYGVNQTQADHAESGEEVTIIVDGVTKALVDGSGTSLSDGDQLMPSSGTPGMFVSHDGQAGSAFAGEIVHVEDGSSQGEEAYVRLYGDRTETT